MLDNIYQTDFSGMFLLLYFWVANIDLLFNPKGQNQNVESSLWTMEHYTRFCSSAVDLLRLEGERMIHICLMMSSTFEAWRKVFITSKRMRIMVEAWRWRNTQKHGRGCPETGQRCMMLEDISTLDHWSCLEGTDSSADFLRSTFRTFPLARFKRRNKSEICVSVEDSFKAWS